MNAGAFIFNGSPIIGWFSQLNTSAKTYFTLLGSYDILQL